MIKPWKKLKEELVYNGYRKVLKQTYEIEPGKTAEFDIFKSGKVSSILALTEDDQVIIAEQFRPGPEKIIMELPGGKVDAGEEPETAAARELMEETGYVGDLQFITTSWHGAYSTLQRYHYVATNCKKVAEPKGDEHEIIEVKLMSLEEFKKHLRSGELTDVSSGYLGLDFLGLL